MEVSIHRSPVGGSVRAPGSKSYSHRAILAGGYADSTRVSGALVSADTRATIRAIEAFGAHVTVESTELAIEGFAGDPGVPNDVIDCANSGTTMRLVTGMAGLIDGLAVLTGDSSLRDRPHGPLLSAIEDLGGRALSTRNNGQAPLVVGGPIPGGSVSIPGDVSSQFITSLLMAGGVTDRGVTITLKTALKSAPYVEITRELLDSFGIQTSRTTDGFEVPGGQEYDPAAGEYHVPGDFSSISYLLAAGVLAGSDGIEIRNAFPSAQGDAAIVDIVTEMGGTVSWDRERGTITAHKSALEGTTVDVSDTPDLLPTIAVLGAAASGVTRIENAAHVRFKETDRVAVMAETLTKLGADVEEGDDGLVIDGDSSRLRGASVGGYGDHRIVMALAIAGLVADGKTTISGAEHVDVSFPAFFDVLYELGARIERT